MLNDKRILLIITGGIAAYKSLELIRAIKKQGGSVSTILTKAAKQFVTPLSVATLAGEKAFDDLFDLNDETEIGHIELSRAADLIVVAPATADIIAKMANGMADDLATTTLLATDKPVMIAPAMNVRMWEHVATQRNVLQLHNDGIMVVGPDEGEMACGEYGPGRMAEPEAIIAAIIEALSPVDAEKPLQGKRVLITAGPTHEPIDPVRYIANRSSGRQGYALAIAAERLGAKVILISGPVNLDIPPGIEVLPVETASEMLQYAKDELPVDIAIFAAAVADWKVKNSADEKLKKQKGQDSMQMQLVQNPDILQTMAKLKTNRPQLVVGFAAETENLLENAKAKLLKKGCDMIIANDVSHETGIMGGNDNQVHIITADKVESWPKMSKQAVADRLMEYLAAMLGHGVNI